MNKIISQKKVDRILPRYKGISQQQFTYGSYHQLIHFVHSTCNLEQRSISSLQIIYDEVARHRKSLHANLLILQSNQQQAIQENE